MKKYLNMKTLAKRARELVKRRSDYFDVEKWLIQNDVERKILNVARHGGTALDLTIDLIDVEEEKLEKALVKLGFEVSLISSNISISWGKE